MTMLLFDDSLAGLTSKQIISATYGDNRLVQVHDFAIDVVDLAVVSGACKSKSSARKLLKDGGMYINKIRVVENRALEKTDLIDSEILLLRTGKGNFRIIQFPSTGSILEKNK